MVFYSEHVSVSDSSAFLRGYKAHAQVCRAEEYTAPFLYNVYKSFCLVLFTLEMSDLNSETLNIYQKLC